MRKLVYVAFIGYALRWLQRRVRARMARAVRGL
jgi:hypothetical protein